VRTISEKIAQVRPKLMNLTTPHWPANVVPIHEERAVRRLMNVGRTLMSSTDHFVWVFVFSDLSQSDM